MKVNIFIKLIYIMVKAKSHKRKHINNGMKKTAKMSQDGKCRYRLGRIWDDSKPIVLFIMHNPSTADADKDDQTIRRLVNFVKSLDFGGFYVCNLCAERSKDPKVIQHTDNLIDEKNIEHIQSTLELVEKVVYAWGNKKEEPSWLYDLMKEKKIRPYCLGVSKKGIPFHPLYKRLDFRLYLRYKEAPKLEVELSDKTNNKSKKEKRKKKSKSNESSKYEKQKKMKSKKVVKKKKVIKKDTLSDSDELECDDDISMEVITNPDDSESDNEPPKKVIVKKKKSNNSKKKNTRKKVVKKKKE